MGGKIKYYSVYKNILILIFIIIIIVIYAEIIVSKTKFTGDIERSLSWPLRSSKTQRLLFYIGIQISSPDGGKRRYYVTMCRTRHHRTMRPLSSEPQ